MIRFSPIEGVQLHHLPTPAPNKSTACVAKQPGRLQITQLISHLKKQLQLQVVNLPEKLKQLEWLPSLQEEKLGCNAFRASLGDEGFALSVTSSAYRCPKRTQPLSWDIAVPFKF